MNKIYLQIGVLAAFYHASPAATLAVDMITLMKTLYDLFLIFISRIESKSR